MTPTIQTQQTFRIHLIAASPAASLAILSIASILGIESQQAADRLASLPTVLAEDVAGPEAQRLSVLLMALGLRVRLDPTFSSEGCGSAQPIDLRRDLALHVVAGNDRRSVAARLVRYLGKPEANIAAELAGPEGLVLRGMDDAGIAALQLALRRDKGVRLTVADPEASVFDAFAIPDMPVPAADLMRLGLVRCRFSGAVAAAMNHATAQHLARRASGRLIIVNRKFQRFDLHLRAAPGLAPRELAGFLDSRPGARLPVAPDGPRRIDADLPHHVAVQFTADYAAIGFEVTARLRGAVG